MKKLQQLDKNMQRVLWEKQTDAVATFVIQRALSRNWTVNHRNVEVAVKGHCATLTGTCVSIQQKDEAGRVASREPVIFSVDNELVIV